MQLEAAGYSTVLQAWDFRPGSDVLHEMQQAATSAGRRPSSGLSVTDPGPARRRPRAILSAVLTANMPTSVARVLQEKP